MAKEETTKHAPEGEAACDELVEHHAQTPHAARRRHTPGQHHTILERCTAHMLLTHGTGYPCCLYAQADTPALITLGGAIGDR